MDNDNTNSAEFLILENIYASSPQISSIKQRDLSKLARTSLGMTNSILKRLTQKGWITIKKINSRNIMYAVTLDGINEILKRSYNYFKRTVTNISFYRDIIDEHIQKAARNNINTIMLIGISDLEFIVEHCCHRYGLSFIKALSQDILQIKKDLNIMAVFSENIPVKEDLPDCLFLSDLIIKAHMAVK